MTTLIDIKNNALVHLGQPLITSSSSGRVSDLLNQRWPSVRDGLLRSFYWNFAIKRFISTSEVETPTWGFLYQHQPPSDFLRLMEIDGAYMTVAPEYDNTSHFSLEGGKILSNQSTIKIKYVGRIEDPNLFDPLFTEMASIRLAYELCDAITQNNTQKKLLWEGYDVLKAQAIRSDSTENATRQFTIDEFGLARL